MINFDDLKPGDILIQETDNMNDSGEGYTHALMYVGKQGNDHLVVAHAYLVDNKPEQSVVGISKLPMVEYNVFRCTDSELAKNAALQAITWSRFQVPYDVTRANIVLDRKDLAKKHFEDDTGHDAVDEGALTWSWSRKKFNNTVIKSQALSAPDLPPPQESRIDTEEQKAEIAELEKENSSGMSRALKFAIRQNTCPTRPIDPNVSDKQMRGMNCSFFVVTCYQVAAIKHLVTPLTNGEWNSEKHDTVDGLPTSKVKEHWLPKDCSPDDYDFHEIPDSIKVDAKIIDCNGLVWKLKQTPDQWENKGNLDRGSVPTVDPQENPTEYAEYRQKRIDAADIAKIEKSELSATLVENGRKASQRS